MLLKNEVPMSHPACWHLLSLYVCSLLIGRRYLVKYCVYFRVYNLYLHVSISTRRVRTLDLHLRVLKMIVTKHYWIKLVSFQELGPHLGFWTHRRLKGNTRPLSHRMFLLTNPEILDPPMKTVMCKIIYSNIAATRNVNRHHYKSNWLDFLYNVLHCSNPQQYARSLKASIGRTPDILLVACFGMKVRLIVWKGD